MGEWMYSSIILILALDGGEGSASRLNRSTARKGAPDISFIEGWVGGPQSQSERCGKGKNPLHLSGIKPAVTLTTIKLKKKFDNRKYIAGWSADIFGTEITCTSTLPLNRCLAIRST
jgi:hypothetical protein